MRTKNYTSSPWSQSCIVVVSVHLMPVRCGPITAVAMLQVEQRRGNCTGRCASQHATPSHAPRLFGTSPHQRQFVACSRDGQSTHKLSGLLGPTTANFQSNDHKLRPSTNVLFASGLPGEPPHHACPLAVVACHRGATHTPWWCQWPPGPHHAQANRRPPPPICVHPKHSALGRPCHGSSNLCALVRQLLCRCVP